MSKGALTVGADADLALVDLGGTTTVRERGLFYRRRMSPYVGRTFGGRVVRTIVRGRTVFLDGKVVSEPAGRLVRPEARMPSGSEQHANVRER